MASRIESSFESSLTSWVNGCPKNRQDEAKKIAQEILEQQFSDHLFFRESLLPFSSELFPWRFFVHLKHIQLPKEVCESDFAEQIYSLKSLESITLTGGEKELGKTSLILREIEHLASLSLWSFSLHSYPVDLCFFRNLEELEIYGSSLETLPLEFASLKKIRKLILSENFDFKKVPECVCQLPNLEVLDVCQTSVTSIPLIPSLQKLFTGGNEIPFFEEKMPNLKVLLHSGASLQSLPSAKQLKRIENLVSFAFSWDKRKEKKIPEQIGGLVHLKELRICGRFGEKEALYLPDSIGKMKSLQRLDLLFDQFYSSKSITDLKNLNSMCRLRLRNKMRLFFPDAPSLALIEKWALVAPKNEESTPFHLCEVELLPFHSKYLKEREKVRVIRDIIDYLEENPIEDGDSIEAYNPELKGKKRLHFTFKLSPFQWNELMQVYLLAYAQGEEIGEEFQRNFLLDFLPLLQKKQQFIDRVKEFGDSYCKRAVVEGKIWRQEGVESSIDFKSGWLDDDQEGFKVASHKKKRSYQLYLKGTT